MIPARNPARIRRRLMAAVAVGLLLVLPCAMILQAGIVEAHWRPWLLGCIALGVVFALPASVGLTALQFAALRRPSENAALNDELSTRNSVRAMAVGYVIAVAVSGLALPLSLSRGWPAAPLLTAVVLSAVVAHAASFAWLERQGDDEGDDG